MLIVSDFHSHILPGLDDGAATLEESVALLELEQRQGVSHVVLTPHFYAHRESPRDFLRRRDEAMARLNKVLETRPELPAVTVGAEVAYYVGMSESEELGLLTIGDSDCILVEMPPSPWPRSVYRELKGIMDKQGLTPIIAHVDRYIRPLHTYGIPRRLEQLGIPVQANANFFIRRETARMALRMLKAGRIHLIGSDCHNLHTRRPNLAAAVNKIESRLGREHLSRISETEHRILEPMELNGVIE